MKGTIGLCAEDLGLASDYMPRQCSLLWKIELPAWREKLDAAAAKIPVGSLQPIFFRADDIGAAGRAFEALCRLFLHHRVPLALAVVPAWLSEARQERLFSAAPMQDDLWSWHQHGWRHVNWQKSGRNAEFGDDRPFDRQYSDILQGRQKMELIFGKHFTPIFTPPWGRFSSATVKILRNLDFKAISTFASLPQGVRIPWDLHGLPVRLDLHTRHSKHPEDDLDKLLDEFGALASAREPAGILLHHHRMTPFAFDFLDRMLYNLKSVINARFYSFKEILNHPDEKQAGAPVR
jgi:peptidoglycan/xylan/chitin deacetylase (PgdA/CDA1 family)